MGEDNITTPVPGTFIDSRPQDLRSPSVRSRRKAKAVVWLRARIHRRLAVRGRSGGRQFAVF